MNILHVVAGLPASGSGIAEVVSRLAREAARLGHMVTIATVAGQDADLPAAANEALATGVSIERFGPSAPGTIHFSRQMAAGLQPLACKADVVHVHSNWTFPVWWRSEGAHV